MLKRVNLKMSELLLAVFAILPFWIFIGMSNQMTVNGEIVSDYSVNFFGIIAGLALGWYATSQALNIIGDRRKPAEERSIDVKKYTVGRLVLMIAMFLLGVTQLLVSTGMV